MLFLQHAADGPAHDALARTPVDDAAGLCLERALLAADQARRLVEVERALAKDRNLAAWALRTAENRLGRTINRIDEAAAWLSDHLVTELSAVLGGDCSESSTESVSWRLPALLRKLFEYERQQANFENRLEHEKLEGLKELAYGASHEINNPLANIAARAQTLLDDEQDPQRRQKLIAIHRQAMRAHEMISDLMLFARPPKLNLSSFELREFVGKVVGGMSTLAQENGIQMKCVEGDTSVQVFADETQLSVALHSIVKNAIEAANEAGRVTVAIRRTDAGDQSWAEILVRDDGPGITAEMRRHMFDPFFSGREAGRGLGFGLSKCWRIVTDHGGQVLVNSPAAGGAEVSILLPLTSTPASVQSPAR
jgi:signal transduction histidine kinase